MAKVPKVGDAVVRIGSPVTYVITAIDAGKKTADIKSTKGGIILHRGILWTELSVLDESQNAARIVREATEEK